MPKFNDIDLKNWREYSDINTSSLWLIDKRKKDELNKNVYHGNFVPQIPEQMIKRYTKKGDVIFDPFVGSGTTIYEAIYNGRIGIGIDLNLEMVNYIESNISSTIYQDSQYKVIAGDSSKKTTFKHVQKYLAGLDLEKVQHVILHPPYNDIIKFNELKEDLSNKETLNSFLKSFKKVVSNSLSILENDRHVSLVIGDQYKKGELIPISALTMQVCIDLGLKLKGIIIKDYQNTKLNSDSTSIWRYRALASDYFTFKHEYIYVFKKVKTIK